MRVLLREGLGLPDVRVATGAREEVTDGGAPRDAVLDCVGDRDGVRDLWAEGVRLGLAEAEDSGDDRDTMHFSSPAAKAR